MVNKPINILVVDDSKSLGYLYKSVFSNIPDCKLSLCGSIEEARGYLERKKPDLLILDIDLPDGSGIDFLKEIRAKGSNTEVIIISAVNRSSIVVEGAKLGVKNYLIKPIDINLLMSKVKEIFNLDDVS